MLRLGPAIRIQPSRLGNRILRRLPDRQSGQARLDGRCLLAGAGPRPLGLRRPGGPRTEANPGRPTGRQGSRRIRLRPGRGISIRPPGRPRHPGRHVGKSVRMDLHSGLQPSPPLHRLRLRLGRRRLLGCRGRRARRLARSDAGYKDTENTEKNVGNGKWRVESGEWRAAEWT